MNAPRAALPADSPVRPLGIYNGGVVIAVRTEARAISNSGLDRQRIAELFAGHRQLLRLWPSDRWPGWSAGDVKQAIIAACARLGPVSADILLDLGLRPYRDRMRAVRMPKPVALSRFPSRVIPFPQAVTVGASPDPEGSQHV